MGEIAVLGAGIIGLSAATEIQRLCPSAQVTLISEKFSPDTTSDVAAGFWNPVFLEDKRTHLINRWAKQTYNLLAQLSTLDPRDYGTILCPAYLLNSCPQEGEEKRLELLETGVRDVHVLDETDLRHVTDDLVYRHGLSFTSYTIEGVYYLPTLLEQFRDRGGRVVQKKVDNFDQFCAQHPQFSTIVNTTGLGARELMNDKLVHAVRGQVFRIRAPFIRHAYMFENGDTARYVLPNLEATVVGGTHTDHDWNVNWSERDARDIWNDVTRLVPAVKHSQIVSRRVGLRPGRHEAIRLETEAYRLPGGRQVNVVHNYGHGGSGLTLFHGCALDCARMAVDCHLRVKGVAKL